MVVASLRNSIPKSVVYCQVREAKRSLLDHFFADLGKKEVRISLQPLPPSWKPLPDAYLRFCYFLCRQSSWVLCWMRTLQSCSAGPTSLSGWSYTEALRQRSMQWPGLSRACSLYIYIYIYAYSSVFESSYRNAVILWFLIPILYELSRGRATRLPPVEYSFAEDMITSDCIHYLIFPISS